MYSGVATINAGEAHTASWFNPRSGAKTLIAALPKGMAKWAVPATRPGGDKEAWRDWVLLIEPASDVVDSAVGGADISWVTSVSAKGRMRPAPSGGVGCSFVAPQAMTVTQLCRLAGSGNNNIETVAIFSAANGTVVVSAGVDAQDKQHDEHGFVCTAIEDSAVLAHGQEYYLTLNTKCDTYHDDTGTTIEVVGGAAAQVKSIYGAPLHVKSGGGGANHCYGPLNFHFSA